LVKLGEIVGLSSFGENAVTATCPSLARCEYSQDQKRNNGFDREVDQSP
jgi:hypothetical protein